MTRSLRKWSEEADAKLQDCFASTDWNMFWDSSNGIEEYTKSVIGFINNCIDDVIPTANVHTYPNQKPWITGNIHTELKARAAAFKELQLKQAKCQYRTTIDAYYAYYLCIVILITLPTCTYYHN